MNIHDALPMTEEVSINDKEIASDILDILSQVREAAATGRLVAAGVILAVSSDDHIVGNSILYAGKGIPLEVLVGLSDKADQMAEEFDRLAEDA